jgi:hypothetical protein
MSSGLTVGVGWQLSDDLDPDQRDVCRLLERDPARLGPTQLTTLRRHFAARIKAARSVSSDRPYRELLAEVLDYRQWRVFAFTLHRPGGTLTRIARAGPPLPDVIAVLRAAAGRPSRPLICTEGAPSAAVHALLRAARPATPIHWRNDFDWAGVRLTAAALARYPTAAPWRMGLTDYTAAAPGGVRLVGTPADTPRDPGLPTPCGGQGSR